MTINGIVALITHVALVGSFLVSVPSGAPTDVPYPEGYRQWAHVKSALISPTHANYAATGGFTHTYANTLALEGYRTREFPEGSIIVVDWLEMRDSNGAYSEGARRQIDVMMKDARRFAGSGGWGFQRFVKDSKTDRSATLQPAACFACHDRLRKDGLVLGVARP